MVVAIIALSCTAQAKPTDCADWRSDVEKAHPESVAPEPTALVIECDVRRQVRCVPPSPVRSAWQMTPFTQCPRSTDRWQKSVLTLKPQFSRKETRAKRLANKNSCAPTPEDGQCCYVQFSADACD